MNEELKAKMKVTIDAFYQSEEKLCRSMTAESYKAMLQKVNYDFHSVLPIIKKDIATQSGFYPSGIPGAAQNPGAFQYPQVPNTFPQVPGSATGQASPKIVPQVSQNTGVEVTQIPPQTVPEKVVPQTATEVPVKENVVPTQPELNSPAQGNVTAGVTGQVKPPATAPVTPEEIQSMLS